MAATLAVAVTLAVTLALAACSSDEPRPHTVDVAAIAASDLIAAVLDDCHKPLRGRMDRIAARVRPADGSEVRLFAALPDKLRTQSADGAFLL
ncbi:MAG: hypothetical protein ABIP94_15985, partial [Planctomycetota bacterium]